MLPNLAQTIPIFAALHSPTPTSCPYYMDPCAGKNGWLSVSPVDADKIPTDGVLLLQTSSIGAPDPATLELTVTLDGQPIAGATEATSAHGVLAWRPAEPWAAGATHHVVGSIPGYDTGVAYACSATTFDLDFDLFVDAGPSDELAEPTLDVSEMLIVSPIVSLDSLVCCVGAPPPTQGYSGCYGGNYVNWDPMQCTPTQAHGHLAIDAVSSAAATDATGGQVVYELFRDGVSAGAPIFTQSFQVTSEAPVCLTVVAKNLGTGATAKSKEQCVGQDVADKLGAQTLDPSEKLTCRLERCENDGLMWDGSACVPVAPDTSGELDPDEDKGCACDGRGTGPPLLALVVPLGLALGWRRRARR